MSDLQNAIPQQHELDKQLNAQTSVLEAAQIDRQLDMCGCVLSVEVVPETGSTNADLMARLHDLQGPVLRIALHQTAGRGRAGRTWHSAPGGMLMFSIAWRMSKPAHALTGLPLAIGVVLAETLQQLHIPVQLKWPNDLLRDGKKLAGILVESASDQAGKTWVVVGVGLNLSISAELEQQIGREVADAPWLANMDRNRLMAILANALAAMFEQFDQQGFTPFLPRWNQLHAYAGQMVQIIDHGQVLHRGVALGVDLAGCLVLQTQQGQVTVLSGDVSLRPLDTEQ